MHRLLVGFMQIVEQSFDREYTTENRRCFRGYEDIVERSIAKVTLLT